MFFIKNLKYLSLLLLLLLFQSACENANPNWEDEINNPGFLVKSCSELTNVIVHDIFSPPVASRIYVYPSIAAYECARFLDSTYLSMAGQLAGLGALPLPSPDMEYAYSLSAIIAFNKVAGSLVFSEDKLKKNLFKPRLYY